MITIRQNGKAKSQEKQMGKPQKLGLQQNHQNGKAKENWLQSDNLPKTLAQPLKNLKQNQSDIKSFHHLSS